MNHSANVGLIIPPVHPSIRRKNTARLPFALAGPPEDVPFAFLTSYPRILALSHASGLLPSSFAFSVGHNEEPRTLVDRTNGRRRYSFPLRIVPERGKVSENSMQSSLGDGGHVFHNDESRSNVANNSSELAPQPASAVVKPCLWSEVADSLAREPSAYNVNCRRLKCSDVIVLRYFRPMLI